MSGGALTDYQHNLYLLDEWADGIEKYNPVLADNMHDLEKLLDRYDYWLSGDIGDEALGKAWAEYRDKWLSKSPDIIIEILERRFKECVDIIRGGQRYV